MELLFVLSSKNGVSMKKVATSPYPSIMQVLFLETIMVEI